jgi:hypothetical protein
MLAPQRYLLLLPARGEKVGMRGPRHESEPPKVSFDAQTRETATSPRPSPRTRGEEDAAASHDAFA